MIGRVESRDVSKAKRVLRYSTRYHGRFFFDLKYMCEDSYSTNARIIQLSFKFTFHLNYFTLISTFPRLFCFCSLSPCPLTWRL